MQAVTTDTLDSDLAGVELLAADIYAAVAASEGDPLSRVVLYQEQEPEIIAAVRAEWPDATITEDPDQAGELSAQGAWVLYGTVALGMAFAGHRRARVHDGDAQRPPVGVARVSAMTDPVRAEAYAEGLRRLGLATLFDPTIPGVFVQLRKEGLIP
jgi:hypothetical protein